MSSAALESESVGALPPPVSDRLSQSFLAEVVDLSRGFRLCPIPVSIVKRASLHDNWIDPFNLERATPNEETHLAGG